MWSTATGRFISISLRFSDSQLIFIVSQIVNDNYLDGEYHIPHVHNGLFSILEMKAYKVCCDKRLVGDCSND